MSFPFTLAVCVCCFSYRRKKRSFCLDPCEECFPSILIHPPASRLIVKVAVLLAVARESKSTVNVNHEFFVKNSLANEEYVEEK
jgi:hypothetical protein